MKHYFTLALGRIVIYCGLETGGVFTTHNWETVTCPDCLMMRVLDESLVS